jgi:hypothetical protein
MDILPGITIEMSLSLIVGLMVKLLMFLLLIFAGVMVRQENLMDRVVNLPMGHSLRILVWVFLLMTFILTAIVVVA